MPTATHEQLAEWEACLEHDGKLPANAAPAPIAAMREQGEDLERMRAAIQFLFDDHELIGESEAHCTVQIQHETWRKLKAALNPNPQRDAKGA